jgi:folate-binding protein YgfZ
MFSLEEYRVLREGAGLADRSAFGRLRVAGADRRRYLQGLLTNDIEALAPGTGCYAAYLTPQGRMIADMRLFETGDALLVNLDERVAPTVHERWSRFVFSEDVEVTDVTGSTAEIGLYGPAAPGVLADALGRAAFAWLARDHASASKEFGLPAEAPTAQGLLSMPIHANSRVNFGGSPLFLLRSDEVGVPGFDLVVPIEREADLRALLKEAGATPVGAAALETCRVEAGRPLFHADMDEDTIPLEAGIDDRAISLTKGCYVGQEIIIRVLHRGQGRVARRLVGLTLDPASPVPARGDHVRSGDREIGSITSAVFSPALSRPIALGYVHRDFVDPGTVVTVSHAAHLIHATVAALPFVSVTG